MFAACEGEGATLNGRTLRLEPSGRTSPKRRRHRFHLCVKDRADQARMIPVILPRCGTSAAAVRRRSTYAQWRAGASTPSTRLAATVDLTAARLSPARPGPQSTCRRAGRRSRPSSSLLRASEVRSSSCSSEASRTEDRSGRRQASQLGVNGSGAPASAKADSVRVHCHLPVQGEVADGVRVVVEIPKGQRNKYEMDHVTGRIYLDRMLFTSTRYPPITASSTARWPGRRPSRCSGASRGAHVSGLRRTVRQSACSG